MGNDPSSRVASNFAGAIGTPVVDTDDIPESPMELSDYLRYHGRLVVERDHNPRFIVDTSPHILVLRAEVHTAILAEHGRLAGHLASRAQVQGSAI